MNKPLIAYYSLKGETINSDMKITVLTKGHTALAAEYIGKAVDGVLFEIETVKSYNPNYRKMIAEAKEEWEKGIKPAVKSYPEDFQEYETVFLGYPNWFGTLPSPVQAFLVNLNWEGKRIIPFNTSGGSGLGDSVEVIKKLCPGAEVEQGHSFLGHKVKSMEEEIKNWAVEAYKE